MHKHFVTKVISFQKCLKIEGTFSRKTTGNVTFPHLWCCHSITKDDGPHNFPLLKWVEEGLSFKKMYTLLGLF